MLTRHKPIPTKFFVAVLVCEVVHIAVHATALQIHVSHILVLRIIGIINETGKH